MAKSRWTKFRDEMYFIPAASWSAMYSWTWSESRCPLAWSPGANSQSFRNWLRSPLTMYSTIMHMGSSLHTPNRRTTFSCLKFAIILTSLKKFSLMFSSTLGLSFLIATVIRWHFLNSLPNSLSTPSASPMCTSPNWPSPIFSWN